LIPIGKGGEEEISRPVKRGNPSAKTSGVFKSDFKLGGRKKKVGEDREVHQSERRKKGKHGGIFGEKVQPSVFWQASRKKTPECTKRFHRNSKEKTILLSNRGEYISTKTIEIMENIKFYGGKKGWLKTVYVRYGERRGCLY